ncbi:DUF1641 domain-containing protein [Kineosporia sp. A_224]|uniref:DUF1641 domain-containing protein n=1 Tax=Kineosporia sp. A_224 TaxID=1962180 RepID=UPI000B4AC4F4|nr:DUF1641 domain-containing protein [Kineosporia sp. A_224]
MSAPATVPATMPDDTARLLHDGLDGIADRLAGIEETLHSEREARERWRDLLAEVTSLTGAGMNSLSDVMATAETRGYFSAARYGAGAVDRFVSTLDTAPAPAPSTLALLRRLRDPQVRRGLGRALDLLDALGADNTAKD